MSSNLLAKSRRDEGTEHRPSVSLRDHTKAVVAATRAIMDEITPWLPFNIDRCKLRALAVAGAVLHDLGKANDIFQGKMLPAPSGIEKIPWNLSQPLRHECLSALVVAGYVPAAESFSDHLLKVVSAWDDPQQARWLLAWVVGGHHLQMHHTGDDSAGMVRIAGIPQQDIEFRGNLLSRELDSEFAELLLDPPDLPEFRISTDIGGSDDHHHAALLENFAWESEDRAESLTADDMQILAFAKAILIAADVAGSALWDGHGNEVDRVENGVRASLRNCCTPSDLQAIVRDRLRIARNVDYEKRLHRFQREARDACEPRVVLEAACGGGKTIAAYEWARRHVAAGRKLILCYPTTGTAAAGFDDYLLTQGEVERDLISSRAAVDIQRMLSNTPDGGGDGNRHLGHPERDADLEDLMKQESLQAWGQHAIASTADFVLGLMQNHRRGLFSFPAIARSAIVFDEIHSYDAKMFGSLIRFLSTFPQTPALLMTASLQPSRRAALAAAGVDYRLIGGNEVSEKAPRYSVEWRPGSDAVSAEYWRAVTASVAGGGKVLWVCNTVAAAVEIYRAAHGWLDDQVNRMLFHSRFCYCHRVARQELVLRAFHPDAPGCLAVTTQVCEMSLDISADLLVTQLAPFPALMQRMGRLNRRLEHPDGARCLIYDADCHDGRPYRRTDLDAARDAVQQLTDRVAVVSQHDLKEVLNRIPEAENDIKFHSAWLDGGWESRPATLREGDATLPVLLEQHEDLVRARRAEAGARLAVNEWLVPILPSKKIRVLRRVGGYPLVSGVAYDEEVGAR